jgi:GT2 family glycosyltransferase
MDITVITINRNSGTDAARTVASLRSQRLDSQWVVIDGGSDDGSELILRRSLRPIDCMISEIDHGIADAFNKGLRLASGDAVLFMNAGDEFASPDSLVDLMQAWDRRRHRWIIGAGDILREDGAVLFRRRYTHAPPDPLSLVRRNCRIMHQAVLAERSLFTEHGGFDESFRIAMDYELWIRWLTRGLVPQMVDVPVCRFHRGGASGDPMRNHAENRRAREMHGIGNGPMLETALAGLAWLKGRIRGRYGRWTYKLKERLGVRI